ncbi:MAG: N-acetylmuramoyl-L-alanine amidase [Gemmatimonadetes bacterium]|nr:N-acetylmuramoyl-L-alanine amidase [Gemmatimonadota bacterium]
MHGTIRPIRPLPLAARAAAAVVVLAAGACRPAPAPAPGPTPPPAPASVAAAPVYVAHGALPPIPTVDGPLRIRVVHPGLDDPRPAVDSTFVFGSVGSGSAALTINGTPVAVAPNGAFLAFLPVPADGSYPFAARRGGDSATVTTGFRPAPPGPPAPASPAAPDTAADAQSTPAPAQQPSADGTIAFPQPLAARALTGDTLATGSDVAIGRPTPTGTYRWFLPRGARLVAIGKRADMVQVRLDSATVAWFPDTALSLGAESPAVGPTTLGRVTARRDSAWVDVRIPAGGAPFLVEDMGDTWRVRLHGVTAVDAPAVNLGDPMLDSIASAAGEPGSAQVTLSFARRPWGYKAFYAADGALVLRIRRGPSIDPASPLRGIRIVIDPGHPPGGAVGPTGLTEAEANLAVALPLADQLRAAGATVMLTRTTNAAVGLAERTAMAARWNADLLVSVHNNAFPEGENPFTGNGTSTYWFHPSGTPLAQALDREVVGVTGIRDLGAHDGNLALVRATWFPSTLTESLFMMVPEQEAALRDPAFLARLAAAHVRGIEAFLRSRASGAWTTP